MGIFSPNHLCFGKKFSHEKNSFSDRLKFQGVERAIAFSPLPHHDTTSDWWTWWMVMVTVTLHGCYFHIIAWLIGSHLQFAFERFRYTTVSRNMLTYLHSQCKICATTNWKMCDRNGAKVGKICISYIIIVLSIWLVFTLFIIFITSCLQHSKEGFTRCYKK